MYFTNKYNIHAFSLLLKLYDIEEYIPKKHWEIKNNISMVHNTLDATYIYKGVKSNCISQSSKNLVFAKYDWVVKMRKLP